MGLRADQVEIFWSGVSQGARARYTELAVVGSGSNAVVVRAVDSKTNTMVAIKRISSIFVAPEEAVRVLRELRLLSDLHHPNIISLKAVLPPDGEPLRTRTRGPSAPALGSAHGRRQPAEGCASGSRLVQISPLSGPSSSSPTSVSLT
jgi:serine/threonine protein kinase